MRISRRSFVGSAASVALLGSLSKLMAQSNTRTTLSVPWMGWVEEQVTPLVNAFEQQSDISLAIERLPITELFRTLEIRLQARNALPDVYLVDGPLTASYAARGHLFDLGELLADDLERFIPTALTQGTYRDTLYAMPIATSSPVLFYNKKLFAEAGLPLLSDKPEERISWEDMLPMAQALTKPEIAQFGFAFEFINPYQLLCLPQSLGVDVIGPDGLTASGYVNSEEMIEVFHWYQDLFQKHKVSPIGVFQGAIAQEMFGQGKLAMLAGGTWNLNNFEKFESLDFGVAPHPYFRAGKPITQTGSWHIGINPRTAHMPQAQSFIKWMSTLEAMNLFFDLRQYPPVLKQIWLDRAGVDFAHPAWSIVQYELANTATPRPATPGYREYEDFFKIAMQDMQTGSDVRETLTRAAANIDREMRKYR